MEPSPQFKNPLLRLAASIYQWIIYFNTRWLSAVFLLVIRLYWGWQFHTTGMGKLQSIDKVTGYFQSLGVPFPRLNVYLAGSAECFGGLLLLLGVASRLTTIPLIFTMIIALLTAFPDAVKNVFSKPDDFLNADPFLFLFAALIVFIFGPGPLSIDGLIGYLLKKKTTATPPVA